MTVARNRYPDDDPAAQIVASAAAFRRWALGSPAEFRLVFATPLPDESDADTAPGSREAQRDRERSRGPKSRPSRVRHRQRRRPLRRLLQRDLRPSLGDTSSRSPPTRTCTRPSSPCSRPTSPATVTDGFRAITPSMVWMFERAWARLYGTVTLEVFGHVREFIRSGALFESMLDVGRDLGLADEWDPPRRGGARAHGLTTQRGPAQGRAVSPPPQRGLLCCAYRWCPCDRVTSGGSSERFECVHKGRRCLRLVAVSLQRRPEAGHLPQPHTPLDRPDETDLRSPCRRPHPRLRRPPHGVVRGA